MFHPNLVIAGTYSGQIVMWDLRCNKRTPIQRSSLSSNNHVVNLKKNIPTIKFIGLTANFLITFFADFSVAFFRPPVVN